MSHWWDTKKQRWRWGVDLQLGGKRQRPTKLLPKGWRKDQAAKYDRIQTERLIAEASGVQPIAQLIDAAVAAYLDEKIPNLKTGKNIAQELTHLIDFIEGRPFSDLPDVFIEYAKANRELAPATVRNRLAYLRAACRYAYKYKRIGDADSLARLSIPVVSNTRTTRVDDAGFGELITKLSAEDGAFVTLAYFTALRPRAEIHRLGPSNVRRIGNEIWLECGKTKNGEPHMVLVHPEAEWAVDYLPFKLGYREYYDALKTAAAEIGRPELWMYDMRRSFASGVLSRGGTIDDVQIALNQKSRAAAERYAHMDLTRKKAIFGRFPHTTQKQSKREKPKKAA